MQYKWNTKKLLEKHKKQARTPLNKYLKIIVKCKLDNTVLSSWVKREYSLSNIVDNFVIKSNDHYSIIKEENTRTYILSFHNIYMTTISKTESDKFKQFKYLYENSSQYCFDIYESDRYYHIFCVNMHINNKQDYNHLHWISSHDANISYKYLSSIYKSFIVMNRHWLRGSFNYKYTGTLGLGIIKDNTRSIIKCCLRMVNEQYIEQLPFHYLEY